MNQTEMLHQMCHKALAEADIRAICKNRGLPNQTAPSRHLLENLFVSDTGVAAALRTLDRAEIALLHLLGGQDKPVDIAFFIRLDPPKSERHFYGTFTQRFQGVFSKVKDRLVRSGVLLLALARESSEKKTNMERWQFDLPVQFARHLPPLLESAKRLSGEGDFRKDVARQELKTAVSPLADDVTKNERVEIVNDELRWGGQPFRAERVVEWQKRQWQAETEPAKRRTEAGAYGLPAAEAVLRILASMDTGLWSNAEALAAPLEIFCGHKVDAGSVCESGWRWGLLTRQQDDGQHWYRLAPPSATADPPPDRYLAFRGENLTVDLNAAAFEALETLVLISDQRPATGGQPFLRVAPNLIKLGRIADTVAALPLADWLQKNAPVFHRAFETVRQRYGRTILHENLSVARVSDLSLKVALEKALGKRIVPLGKEFIAFPREAVAEIKRLVAQMGHVVKEDAVVNLESIDIAALDVAMVSPDLRRDIHVFVDYVRTREVKRSHRGNALSKSDAKRLAKLMSGPDEVDDEGFSAWVDFIDDVTRQLGFVHYDLKGEYLGHTSQEPSFPDNFIEFRAKPYGQFLATTAAKQETTLLELLVREGQGSASEFYRRSTLGRLDGFNYWGSAVGVMPTLDFTAVRRFLLKLLSDCPSNQWLSVSSLVEHLNKHQRYFLIPAKPRFTHKHEAQYGRYGNFHESKEAWGYEIDVHESDPDGFERVEGRYVERFLEGIPLLLRYVDVAYTKKPSKAIYPSLGCLKAFRVNDRLLRALEGRIAEPRLTVTPNFEVHVIAETYPAGALAHLAPLCEMVSQGASIVLKLTKQKVAAARAASPELDPAGLLQMLSGGELPANVGHELSEWSEHGEKFTLYENCCVLETDQDLPAAEPFMVERVAAGIRLVRSPDKLFDELERRELMPVRIKHGDKAFAHLPKNAPTRFPKGGADREKSHVPKPHVKLTRITRVQLVCPDREVLDRLHQLLLARQCPAELDRPNLTLTYSKQYEPAVADAIRSLKTEYRVEIR